MSDSNEIKKMSSFEKTSYQIMSVGIMLVLSLYNSSYAYLFLTNVCGLSIARAASSQGIARVLNLLTVLFLQPILLDWSAKQKWGRYITWFVISPFLMITGHLMMQSAVTALGSEQYMYWMAMFGYLILNIGVDLQYTAIFSLGQSFIRDPAERLTMQARMNLTNNITSMLFGFVLLPAIYYFGGVDFINSRGMTVMVAVYNVINFIVLQPIIKATKDLDQEGGMGQQPRVSAIDILKGVAANKRLAPLFWCNAIGSTATMSWGQVFAYIFLYYFKDPAMLSAYNGVSRGISIIATSFVLAFSKKLKLNAALRFGYIGTAIGYLCIFFFAQNALMGIIFVAINSLFTSMSASSFPPSYSEVAEYIRYESDENLGAVVFTCQLAINKVAAYGSNIMVSALGWIGFSPTDPNTHTSEVLRSMKAICTLVPAGLLLAALLIHTLFHKLTPEKMAEARKALPERSAAKA
ncbi:MAG: MFS transporter [Eubacteriaceae bacterium]|nr:MFS transporter [Eubacteriaceae bacterium]